MTALTPQQVPFGQKRAGLIQITLGVLGGMERLSGLDAGLLYSESSSVPLHVCSIVELDTSTVPGGYSFVRFRDELAKRIPAVPEFRAKLADSELNLDHPVWVEDEDFDLSRHLNRIALPAPGGREELADVCGHIASVQLDRSKPLWEMWVIEGWRDRTNSLALMIKVHHAAVDGVSAANLLNQLLDSEPDAPPPEPVDGPGGASSLGITVDGLVRFVDPAAAADPRGAGGGDDGGQDGEPGDQPAPRWRRRSPRRPHRSTAS